LLLLHLLAWVTYALLLWSTVLLLLLLLLSATRM
jgi:hypothetical protein